MPTTLPSSTPSSDFTAPHSLTAVAVAAAVADAVVGTGEVGGTAPYGNTGCRVINMGYKAFKIVSKYALKKAMYCHLKTYS